MHAAIFNFDFAPFGSELCAITRVIIAVTFYAAEYIVGSPGNIPYAFNRLGFH